MAEDWTVELGRHLEESQFSLEEALRFDDCRSEEMERQKIIRACLIEAADYNYLVARQAYRLSSGPDFWWLMLQAIEKYLKATLLLNGGNPRKHGHDISALFSEVQRELPFVHFADLVPFDGVGSFPTSMLEAMKYIFVHGRPANRYNEEGFQIGTSDLYLADSVILAVRAGCRSFRKFDRSAGVFRVYAPARWELDWHLDQDLPLERADAQSANSPQRQALRLQNSVLDPMLPRKLDRVRMTVSPFLGTYRALRTDPTRPKPWARRVAQWAIESLRLERDTEKMLSDPNFKGDPEITRRRALRLSILDSDIDRS